MTIYVYLTSTYVYISSLIQKNQVEVGSRRVEVAKRNLYLLNALLLKTKQVIFGSG